MAEKKSTLSSRLANNQVSGANHDSAPVQSTVLNKKEPNGSFNKRRQEKQSDRRNKAPVQTKYSLRSVQTPTGGTKEPQIRKTVEADLDEMLEFQELEETQKEYMAEVRSKRVQRIIRISLVCACIYMVFLIYGVFVTTYHYGAGGEIEPQKISAKELRELKEFEKVKVEYEQCRDIYEKVLLLDYRATSGTIDPMTLGPEYSDLNKKETQALITKVKGAKVDSKYTDINTLIYSWLNDCASVYITNEANYLETGQEEYLTNASNAQANMYNAFLNLTQNIVSIGDTVPGADMTEIREWDPQEYVDKKIRNQGD